MPMPMPIVEACEACRLVLTCSGSDPNTKLVCNYGQEIEGASLCTRNPGGCAVSGGTTFVEPGKYPHNCQPLALGRQDG